MLHYPHSSALELWAGVECTVNRVHDQYFDQLECSGHARRLGDLDLFAELGIKTVRYPVLWERVAPRGLAAAEWAWADERLARLQALNIRPIAGLLHHGSGPRETDLLDPRFAEKFAAYARAVAERYPWVDGYTPINEPLTTARFSCLYGLWYPHLREDRAFLQALLNQARATVLAMREIRRVQPAAQLVQTEDLAQVSSTPGLNYQAEFENHRRWLTFDLLSGRVQPDHPLWDYIRGLDISAQELEFFLEEPCPPNLLGCNYYLTSERFLDQDWERYPEETQSWNGQDQYADVEAVRVLPQGTDGAAALLRQVWERYRQPLAITEVHLGCTREEQLRWLGESWQTAHALRAEGVDLRAVTAWAMLGTFDWDSLVTRSENHYEPGLYDVRAPAPRPTALAEMTKHFAAGKIYQHPILQVPGWWHRPERLVYAQTPHSSDAHFTRARPLLITGATGTLGNAFAHSCRERGLAHRLLTRRAMDITAAEEVEQTLDTFEPWAIINAAGYTRIDNAEIEVERCRQENIQGPTVLATACAQRGIPLVTFSTDLVFDGRQTRPYTESDSTAPLNVYGRSKADAEDKVLMLNPRALVIRTSALFGPGDQTSFAFWVLTALHRGEHVIAAEDTLISPTFVPDLVQNALDLLLDQAWGIWHLANDGAVSWAEFARSIAEASGLNSGLVEGQPMRSLHPAPRPSYSVLGSERGNLMPPFQDALGRYLWGIRSLISEGRLRLSLVAQS